MKKIRLLSVLIVFTYLVSPGQDLLKKIEEIDKKETELKQFSADTADAEAVVLFDMAKSYFVSSERSYDIIFERKTKIKILREHGIKWAEIEIPYYREGDIYENVYDIIACAYNNENGQLSKTPFDVSNVFEEKINNNWNVKKFAIPNVKEGSIIEYRYKIRSQYKFNFRDWEFQWKIPVVYSEYEVKMIPFYEYRSLLQGADKFDIYETYEDKEMPRYFGSSVGRADNTYYDMVYKYAMKNVSAFNSEEFVSSIDDYIIKLDIQLSAFYDLRGTKTKVITTWENLIKTLLKHHNFGKYSMKSGGLASKLIEEDSLVNKSNEEKFNYVVDYVKSNYNWNGYYRKFASKTPNKFVEDKHGNSADINLFTIGLLNDIGIESYPLILSSRGHGKINYDYPFNHFFDYVIIATKIDGKYILSDATEVLSLNNRIPARCINDKGLIINKKKVEWLGLECLYTSTRSTFIQMECSNPEQWSVDLLKKATEHDALDYRNNYTHKIDVLKKHLADKYQSIIDSTLSVKNQFEKSKPYSLRYSLTHQPEIVNEKIYISPFMKETISVNPLKQKERRYPIDMVYPRKRVFNTTISIPEGYQLEFVPEDVKIKNELFELNYSIKNYEKQIQVSLDYLFKKSVYEPNVYSKIKFYFREIVKKGNEKIVLSKKTN